MLSKNESLPTMSHYSNWVRRLLLLQHHTRIKRTFCNDTNNNHKDSPLQQQQQYSRLDIYHDLENLDFKKALKIMSFAPCKKEKFGFDFHLVQFFFALMPSLAVYLVAQYARYEMRKMDAELELKKKAEDEQKAKEMEFAEVAETEKMAANPELLKVKERLEALEGMVKEIVVETKKKQPSESTKSTNADQNQNKEETSVDAAKIQKPIQKGASGQPLKQFDSEKVAAK